MMLLLLRALMSSDVVDRGGDDGGDIDAGVPVDSVAMLSSSKKVKE